jgi:hypothetical protein
MSTRDIGNWMIEQHDDADPPPEPFATCYTCRRLLWRAADVHGHDGFRAYCADCTTRCDICQRVLPAAQVLRISDTAVCDTCCEESTE